jgi:hypothetical protein
MPKISNKITNTAMAATAPHINTLLAPRCSSPRVRSFGIVASSRGLTIQQTNELGAGSH